VIIGSVLTICAAFKAIHVMVARAGCQSMAELFSKVFRRS
jgi:hypothetical protein